MIETRESAGRHIHLSVPPEGEEDNLRLQNILAVQRSRRRELEHQRELEDAVEAERNEKEMWKARALALEEKLKQLGVSLSEPFSGGF